MENLSDLSRSRKNHQVKKERNEVRKKQKKIKITVFIELCWRKSRREREEDYSVVMEECVREEISVRYLTVNSMLYTFIFIFVGLLLKTDFSDQV